MVPRPHALAQLSLRQLHPERWLLVLAACVVALAGLGRAHAAEPPQSDFTLAQVFNCDPNGTPGACDQTARGVQPVIDIFFPGPGDYQVQPTGSYFELTFEHSAVLLPSLSTLTILLNGVPVPNSAANPNDAIRLDNTNRDKTTIRVDLPSSVLNRDFNKISLLFYQRFREPCDDPNNPALTSKVYETTKLHYEYAAGFPFRTDLPAFDLKDYPYPFFKAGYTRAGSTYFVFPQNPTRAELSAGASIAAGLGNLAGAQPVNVNAVTVDQLTDDIRANNDLIAIGQPSRNPLVGQLARGTSIAISTDGTTFVQTTGQNGAGTAVDPEAGVLVLTASPFNKARAGLVVSGGSEDALLRAALAISGTQTKQLLQGDSSMVTDPRDLRTFTAAPTTGTAFDRTFADLNLPDTTVTGTGSHTVAVTFDAPPPPAQRDAHLQLIISHSTLLDYSHSSVKVALNGQSVASAPLDASDVNRGVVDLRLAGQAIRPGLNTLQVIVGTQTTSNGTTDTCNSDDPNRAWATLWADSSLHIDAGGNDPRPPDLTYYPYPNLYAGSMTGSYIVTTSDPEVLQRSLETALDLGRRSKGSTFLLNMVRADDLTTDIKQQANLIVVGRPSQNPVIKEINAQLPVQFQTDQSGQVTDKVLQNKPEILIATRDRATLGVDEVIPSPYNPQRTLTLMSGTSSDSLRFGRIALSKPVPSSNVLIASDSFKPAQVLTLETKQTKAAAKASQQSAASKSLLPLITIIFIAAAIALAGYWVYTASRRAQEER